MVGGTATYPSLLRDAKELLDERIGRFLTELLHGSTDPMTSGELLSKSFKAYYSLKGKLEANKLDCAVLALAKSGKSTLLNSFCGATLLPSNNVPETARVVAVEHCSLAGQEPVLIYQIDKQDIEFKGDEAIRAQLEYLNKDVRGRKHRKEDEAILTVKTELAALVGAQQETHVGLRLLDTPGPNEAGEEALKHSVERLLDSVDAVVYVLDYTKLKTKEEAELLTKLSESNPQLIQRLAQRLFFVVNKVDEMHVTEGLPEDELREYVADLVTRQMNIPSFQLNPDQVFLVSAQDALLSRLILGDKATKRERERFAKKAFGKNWQKAKEQDYYETAAEMLEDSHVLDLEDSLLAYLYDHAGVLKLVSLLDGIVKLLTEIKNVAVTGEAAMKVSAETLEAEILELQASLLATSQEFLAVQKEASTVEATVVENVRQRMLNLRGRLLAHIDEVLDPENAQPREESPRSPSGWNWILQKSAAFLIRHRNHPSLDTDAALKAKLTDLHKDIKKQIEVEITEFWHELETATNAKHKELITVINGHLLDLARRIEGSVGKVLDLCLKPLDICLQKPSAEEFHNSIQELLRNGIQRAIKVETKHRQEDTVEWQRRFRGLCNQTEYWQGVPTKKWVSYQEQKITFDLNTESIRAHFHTMVESSIDLSIQRVKEYVHAFMSDQIEKAHDKITSYSKLYTDTMASALHAKSTSAAEQTASLASLQKHLVSVNVLLDDVSKIAKTVSKLFPQLDIDNYEWIEGEEFGEEGKQESGDQAEASSPVAQEASQNEQASEIQQALRELAREDELLDNKLAAELEEAFYRESFQSRISALFQPPALAPSAFVQAEAQEWGESDPIPRVLVAPVKRGASIVGSSSSDDDSEDELELEDSENDDEYSFDDDESESESAYLSEDPDAVYDSDSETSSEEDTSDEEEDEEIEMEGVNSEASDEDVQSEDCRSEMVTDLPSEDSDESFDDETGAEFMLNPINPIAAIETNEDALSEAEAKMYPALAKSLSTETREEAKEEEEPSNITRDAEAGKPDDHSTTWSEHMSQFMSGLGVHDQDTSQLPISNVEADPSSDSTGHFVSSPSGPTTEGDAEAATPLLHSAASEGTSDEWECLSETDIPRDA